MAVECCLKALLYPAALVKHGKICCCLAIEVGCLGTRKGVNLVLKQTSLFESWVHLPRLTLACTLCHRSQELHHYHYFRHFKLE